MTATRDQLVGTWRLVSWETRYEDGSVIHPMGDDAVGFLVYAADGYIGRHTVAKQSSGVYDGRNDDRRCSGKSPWLG